jgi:stearoyl-CoA desaturase (Delta-9 desaturase)
MSIHDGVVDGSQVPQPRKMVSDKRLQSMKRRFVLGLNVVSLGGCVAATADALISGVRAVDIGLFLFMYALTAIGITVGYHRHFAHGSFATSPTVRAVLAVLGGMAGHGPVISWTATHRCHHKYSDVPDDPHSPHLHGTGVAARLRGLWHAHMGWLLDPNLPNSMVFAKDLLHDPLVQRINNLYLVWVALGLVIPAALGAMLTQSLAGAVRGLLWGGLVRLFISFHATCSINSITHTFGRRPFNTPEHSTNLALLAVPTFGEGWHNNHHAFPSSARLGLRWWQIDLGYIVIKAMQQAGLVWNVKYPTEAAWHQRAHQQHGAIL